jgi:hypothetical protein
MLLRWRQQDLAKKSGISLPVVKRVESEPGEIRAWKSTIEAFRWALEKEGIRFVDGPFHGAVLRQNRSDPDTGESPALKRAKPVRAVFKKRPSQPKGLK